MPQEDARFIGQPFEGLSGPKFQSKLNFIGHELRQRGSHDRLKPPARQEIVLTDTVPSEPNLIIGFGKDGAVCLGRSPQGERTAVVRDADPSSKLNVLSRQAATITTGLDDRAQDTYRVENTGTYDIIGLYSFHEYQGDVRRLPGKTSLNSPTAGMGSSVDDHLSTEGQVYLIPLRGPTEIQPDGSMAVSTIEEVLVLEAVTDSRRVEGVAIKAYKEDGVRYKKLREEALKKEEHRAEVARKNLQDYT